jgi:excisionase family DNA binding protein
MQASRIVGVSRRTIYNWIEAGKVRTRRTAGGTLRVLEASLWVAGSES